MSTTRILDRLHAAMIHFDAGDPVRIQHLTKVWAYASLIGREEGLADQTQFILESAALMHDIGIHIAEQKYGHQNGKLQEQEGPDGVRQVLGELGGYTAEQIERICWLVAHHHTYHISEDEVGELAEPYQILIEADFLVNLLEDHESREVAETVLKNIFRTESGKRLLQEMFLTEYSIPAQNDR